MRHVAAAFSVALAIVAAPAAHPGPRDLGCPVTLPKADGSRFASGNRSLRVALWPGGTLEAGMLPGGGAYAVINSDGSIVAKLAWWRGVPGQLTVKGERLDQHAPPLRADIPEGYADTGFQPSGLTFPTMGCWKIHGTVGEGNLTFVVRVVRAQLRSRR
jgi:hypothetical protein